MKLLLQILTLLSVLIIFLFIHNEFVLAAVFLLLILINFKIKYYKGEWKLFFLGLIIGIVLELGGDLVFKLQYWEQASFFGIPLWLPLFWGFAFVLIRRIGNSVVKA